MHKTQARRKPGAPQDREERPQVATRRKLARAGPHPAAWARAVSRPVARVERTWAEPARAGLNPAASLRWTQVFVCTAHVRRTRAPSMRVRATFPTRLAVSSRHRRRVMSAAIATRFSSIQETARVPRWAAALASIVAPTAARPTAWARLCANLQPRTAKARTMSFRTRAAATKAASVQVSALPPRVHKRRRRAPRPAAPSISRASMKTVTALGAPRPTVQAVPGRSKLALAVP